MKILIVDSDRERSRNLCERLQARELSFQVASAESAAQALTILEHGVVDAVATHEKLSDSTGTELLGLVAVGHPQLLRLLLIEPGATAQIPPLHPIAHQTLPGGSDENLLLQRLRQCARVRELIVDPWLRKVVGQGDGLPSPPKLLVELRRVFALPDVSVQAVSEVIERDPALSASILRLATSAYFGLPRKIRSVNEAAMYVGLNTVKGLALSTKLFESFRLPVECPFSLETLQTHSLAVAQVAKNLFDRSPKAEDAFLAGLFHDLGKLVLASRVPAMYAEVLRASGEGGASSHSVERELFGTTHSEVGAYLLALWGFPIDLVDAVLLHHTEFSTMGVELHLAVAVGYADHLANGQEVGAEKEHALKQSGIDVSRGRWYATEHRLLA